MQWFCSTATLATGRSRDHVTAGWLWDELAVCFNLKIVFLVCKQILGNDKFWKTNFHWDFFIRSCCSIKGRTAQRRVLPPVEDIPLELDCTPHLHLSEDSLHHITIQINLQTKSASQESTAHYAFQKLLDAIRDSNAKTARNSVIGLTSQRRC